MGGEGSKKEEFKGSSADKKGLILKQFTPISSYHITRSIGIGFIELLVNSTIGATLRTRCSLSNTSNYNSCMAPKNEQMGTQAMQPH